MPCSVEGSLGLARGTVVLVPFDAQWASLFQRESARIASVVAQRGLKTLFIEHCGSTAVANLSAKPILDLVAGYAGCDLRLAYIDALASDGYEPRGEQGVPGRELLVRGEESHRTHHLHLVAHGGREWRAMLMFRDRLRTSPTLLDDYSQLKQALAAQYSHNRSAYTAGKDDFIASVLAETVGAVRPG